jgi:hypothetical protein
MGRLLQKCRLCTLQMRRFVVLLVKKAEPRVEGWYLEQNKSTFGHSFEKA